MKTKVFFSTALNLSDCWYFILASSSYTNPNFLYFLISCSNTWIVNNAPFFPSLDPVCFNILLKKYLPLTKFVFQVVHMIYFMKQPRWFLFPKKKALKFLATVWLQSSHKRAFSSYKPTIASIANRQCEQPPFELETFVGLNNN